MIYALLDVTLPELDRAAIARAIFEWDWRTIRRYADADQVIHIMDWNEQKQDKVFCLYCLDQVFPTYYRAPKGLEAASAWHFQHMVDNNCLGKIRRSPMLHPLWIKNPSNHGCYVELGCELTLEGEPSLFGRAQCKAIRDGRSYCHLGRRIDPSCF